MDHGQVPMERHSSSIAVFLLSHLYNCLIYYIKLSRITIQPFYDAAFKAKFGNKSESTVDKIIAHAKSIFAHTSLTTVVFVKTISPVLHDPNRVLANEDAEL